MKLDFDFNKKLVMVTGGTKGIGRAVAELFLRHGARVIATYSKDHGAAQKMREESRHQDLCIVKCDVASYRDVEAFYGELDTRDDALSVLVNNAGTRKDCVLGMMKPRDWQSVIDANLTGVYNMSKFAVLNMMRHRYGRIISITSAGRHSGFPGQTNYAASKAGMVAFTKCLARETAKRNITVNCVSPGFIDTGFIEDLPADLKKEYRKRIAMGRFGLMDEVAFVVLFLASEYASYITGSVYDVDGGL